MGGHGAAPPTAQDIIASVSAIALSHFAGSALAHSRRMRAERIDAAANRGNAAKSLLHIEPARIKGTAEAVKALYDAAMPLAAGAGALWAAFGHMMF